VGPGKTITKKTHHHKKIALAVLSEKGEPPNLTKSFLAGLGPPLYKKRETMK